MAGRNLGSLRHGRAAFGALASALLVAAITAPMPALAAEPPSRTTTTYQLDADQAVVHVTVVVTISNNQANAVRTYPCTNYIIYSDGSRVPFEDTCTDTTIYYTDNAAVFVDPSGTNFAATTSGGTAKVTVTPGEAGFMSTAKLTFPRVLFGGSRTTTLTFDLPGGAPRSTASVRAGHAYARFCATPGGAYVGEPESLTILIPSRYQVTQYVGPTLPRTDADGTLSLVLAEAPRPDGTEWRGACFEAFDETAFATAAYTSSSGVQVTLKAWPEDPEWLATVGAAAGGAIDDLEALIGAPPRTKSIEMHEVVAEALGGYAGGSDTGGNARLSEAALDPIVAAHELAHAWFDSAFTSETWLLEGYAEWAAREVLAADACALSSVGAGAPLHISTWKSLPPIPTEADHAAVAAQYAAACAVVTDVAKRVGNDRMREIYAAMVGSEIPYVGGGTPEVLQARDIGWRRWLDLADERALVDDYADLDWLQDELESVGVTGNAAELEGRSRAREAYHRLLSETQPWDPPFAIRDPMTAWSWRAATTAMDTASRAHALREEAVGLVGELSQSHAVEALYEAAKTQAELDAAQAAAEAEHDAAKQVAAASAAALAEQNIVQTIGLLGTDLKVDAAAAVSAVVGADYGGATTMAQAVLATAGNAESSGTIRLLVAGGILLLGLVLLVLRRRIVARRRPAVDTATPELIASEEPPTEPTATE